MYEEIKNKNINIYINAYSALSLLRRFIPQRRTKDILIDVSLSPKKSAYNKTWELELSFFHVLFRLGRYVVGKPFRGYVSCHTIGDFTTYAVSVNDRELWFDRFEFAVASLSSDESPLQGSVVNMN